MVSTQMRERKTGQNRVSRTEEPNVVVVREIKTLVELRTDFLGDAELVIISEVLALNTALRTIELRKNRVGDDGIEALARAIGRGGLPIRVVLLEGNHVSARGATALAEGLLQEVPARGARPLGQCDHVVGRVGAPLQGRRRVRGGAEEGGGGDAPARRRSGRAPSCGCARRRPTAARARWHRPSSPPPTSRRCSRCPEAARGPMELLGGLCGANKPAAAAEAPAAEESAGAPAAAPAAAPPPTAKQLARLDDDQLTRLWEALTAQPRRGGGRTLPRLGGRRGVRAARARPTVWRASTCPASRSAASTAPASRCPAARTVERRRRLCDALRSEHCELASLRLTRSRCARPRRARSRRR